MAVKRVYFTKNLVSVLAQRTVGIVLGDHLQEADSLSPQDESLMQSVRITSCQDLFEILCFLFILRAADVMPMTEVTGDVAHNLLFESVDTPDLVGKKSLPSPLFDKLNN